MYRIMVSTAIALFASTSSPAQVPKWRVRGEALVTCPCKVPCPCRSNAAPSQSHCENLSYVRITQGEYGKTKLDGVEYVWAADECTGRQHPRKPTNFYFAPKTANTQIQAVEHIMSGNHCARTDSADMRSKRVPLSAGASGGIYSVEVPKVLRMDVDLAPGSVPMEPLPALDNWSNAVTYARNITARIDDPQGKLKWDYSGLQANYRSFEIASEFVEKGLLLAMFRDDSGRFNEMHRSLIRELHLEVPLNSTEFQQMLAQVRLPARPVPEQIMNEASGSIAGTVLGPDERSRSGVRIRCKSTENVPVPAVVTNPAGNYFIARVPVGKFELCASSWDGTVAAQSCVPIEVKAEKVLRQDMKLRVR